MRSPLNTKIEAGLRALFIFEVAGEVRLHLDEAVAYDYAVVHSGDFEGGPASIHAGMPNRGGEPLVRRKLVQQGLDFMVRRQLLKKEYVKNGVTYSKTELTSEAIKAFKGTYSEMLMATCQWVIRVYPPQETDRLMKRINENRNVWGSDANFVLGAVRDLDE